MGIEPFIDASNINKQPEPIRYQASDDSRYLFLLKNRPLLDQLRELLTSLNAEVTLHNESILEIHYNGSLRSTTKRRLQWTKDVEKLVEHFLTERLIIHKLPWNNNKIPAITSEQLADLSLKDNTRLFQLSPAEDEHHHIIITVLKDQLDRALNELTDMIAGTSSNKTIPLNDAVYRSKPLSAARDPKVNNHRSSLLLQSSPSRQSAQHFDELISNDSIDNLRLYQLDLLAMRFVELARRTYKNLTIDINRNARAVHLQGASEQVSVCKSYFQSILNSTVHKHYKIGKEMAIFLSNPDTGKNDRVFFVFQIE